MLRKAGIACYVASAGYVGFRELGQMKDAVGYEVITFKDQSVVTGKYSMKVTLGQSTTGGPPGTATERFVAAKDLKLLERTVRSKPVYTDGRREMVPGEQIVRRISPGEWRIDDSYALSVDSTQETEIWIQFYPYQCLSLAVVDSRNRPVSSQRFDDSTSSFVAKAGLRYRVELSGRFSNDCRPDRYRLMATMGRDQGGYESDPEDYTVKWLSPNPSELR